MTSASPLSKAAARGAPAQTPANTRLAAAGGPEARKKARRDGEKVPLAGAALHYHPGVQRAYRAGERTQDTCRVCKGMREHTIVAVDGAGVPQRAICGSCGSEHNYRGGEAAGGAAPRPVPAAPPRERTLPAMSDGAGDDDLEARLRRIIREEAGLTPVAPAVRWRGGQLVLRPGAPGLQEKAWPIDAFFHKIVMLRNRLRTLEQQVNASDLPDDQKIKLQSYVTGCYGTLTSFNILFADESDQFKGSGGD